MDKKFLSNKKLIKHLKKGNELAYNFLIDKYYNILCNYAYSLSRDHFKSEDIVQNVFIRTWELRDNLSADFSIKSFLYKSVYNEFIDQYRKQISLNTLERKYFETINSVYEDDDNVLEHIINVVKHEIEQLPPKCKETFLLSKIEGLTYAEIATYMEVSVKTVETQMSKALSILRKKLGKKAKHILFMLFFIKESQNLILNKLL